MPLLISHRSRHEGLLFCCDAVSDVGTERLFRDEVDGSAEFV